MDGAAFVCVAAADSSRLNPIRSKSSVSTPFSKCGRPAGRVAAGSFSERLETRPSAPSLPRLLMPRVLPSMQCYAVAPLSMLRGRLVNQVVHAGEPLGSQNR